MSASDGGWRLWSSARSETSSVSALCVSCGSSIARKLENCRCGDAPKLRTIRSIGPLEENQEADSPCSKALRVADWNRLLHDPSEKRKEKERRKWSCPHQ